MNIHFNREKHMKTGEKTGDFDVKRDNYRKKKIEGGGIGASKIEGVQGVRIYI